MRKICNHNNRNNEVRMKILKTIRVDSLCKANYNYEICKI